MTRRRGRALHRAIRRHRTRLIQQAIVAGEFDHVIYQAFVDHIANQPGLMDAIRDHRDGLASLPPRAP
jgi:hypothetical protein